MTQAARTHDIVVPQRFRDRMKALPFVEGVAVLPVDEPAGGAVRCVLYVDGSVADTDGASGRGDIAFCHAPIVSPG